jgi:PadR family transcriptional regulator PadR
MTRRGLELIQGTLEFLILEAIGSGEPRHGFGILRWITEATDGALTIEEGALYPALHRMERRGWLKSEWGVSEKNRKAKYYCLTTAGGRQLKHEEAGWREYVDAVGRIVARAQAR